MTLPLNAWSTRLQMARPQLLCKKRRRAARLGGSPPQLPPLLAEVQVRLTRRARHSCCRRH